MKPLLFILAIAFLLFAFPFVRYFAKRVFLAVRLKRLCKHRKFRLHKTHFLWFLGKNSEKNCDFHIETEKGIYSVKLFGSSFRKYFPTFTEDGKVYFKYFIPFLSMRNPNLVFIEGKKRFDGSFDYRYGFQENWKNKESRAFLLIHPNCREMLRLEAGRQTRLFDGDTACGAELTSPKKLVRILEDSNLDKQKKAVR